MRAIAALLLLAATLLVAEHAAAECETHIHRNLRLESVVVVNSGVEATPEAELFKPSGLLRLSLDPGFPDHAEILVSGMAVELNR